MSKRHLKQRSIFFLALVAVLVLSFLSGAGSGPIRAQEVGPMGPTTAPDAADVAPEGLFWCTVSGIWSLTTTIGVNCNPGSGDGISQYAFASSSAADSRQADRFLVIANTALVMNKRIWLGFDNSATTAPPGCSTASCRRVTSMLIEP